MVKQSLDGHDAGVIASPAPGGVAIDTGKLMGEEDLRCSVDLQTGLSDPAG